MRRIEIVDSAAWFGASCTCSLSAFALKMLWHMIARKCRAFIAGSALVSLALWVQAGDEGVHTPPVGSAERDSILAALRAEYTTGSGSAVKFKVNYFKVHNGWAWINVTPLDPNGKIEGEDSPSLLEDKNGKWTIIDLIVIASELDDPVGPMEPNAKFLAAVKKHYPDVPSDIFPKATER